MECVDDSDDWVYGADWIAADADVRKCRRLAAEQHLADKIAEDLLTSRWYLIQSKDFEANASRSCTLSLRATDQRHIIYIRSRLRESPRLN